MSDFVGTISTAAPQIRFHENYTAKCDIFSLGMNLFIYLFQVIFNYYQKGVVYYWMIYNKYPYKDLLQKDEYLKYPLQFPKNGVDGFLIPEEVIDLIKRMLKYEEKERPTW